MSRIKKFLRWLWFTDLFPPQSDYFMDWIPHGREFLEARGYVYRWDVAPWSGEHGGGSNPRGHWIARDGVEIHYLQVRDLIKRIKMEEGKAPKPSGTGEK